VHLSAWARVHGMDRGAMDRALYDDRTLVRMIGMRRTLFAEPVELAPIVHAACGPTIVARERRRLEGWLVDAGVTTTPHRWLARVEDSTVAAIERSGAATAAELAKIVPELAIQMPISVGKPYQGTVGTSTRVLFLLAMDGRIARGRPQGTWISSRYRWEPMHRWVPLKEHAAAHTEASAQVVLVERWLRAFGPGTPEDLQWWTGWSLGAVRRALAMLETLDVDLGDGAVGVVMADDLDEPAATDPWVALLPTLDATTMGWKARDWYLGSHRASLFDRNGNAGPTVWSDGRVVGGWGQRPDGEVVFRMLVDTGAEVTAAVQQRAATLTAWLAGSRIMPRFATPLQLELSA